MQMGMVNNLPNIRLLKAGYGSDTHQVISEPDMG